MGSFSVVLFPVPYGVEDAEILEGATEVSSQTLQDFINANSVPNDELIQDETTENPETEENVEE